MADEKPHNPPNGAQRLSQDRLRAWEQLGYGMFIHFGMSTFVGQELPSGKEPSSTYAPDKLDVDQWVQVARDAGMRYAVLTTKHVAGHCLWPSKQTDYQVGTSGNKTDVVEAFVKACAKHGVMPGFYYCSWDNHNRFGSETPSDTPFHEASTTQKYRDFQLAQVEELLTRYGTIGEVWIDIPNVLGAEGRRAQYDQIARLQPDAVIMMNQGFGDGSKLKTETAWPTDLVAIERWLPSSNRGYTPWHTIEGKEYYVPGEVCDPIGYEWFHVDGDGPRSDGELLGMRLICQARRVNLLLDVPPDKTGRIPQKTVASLVRLRKNVERLGYFADVGE
jgi:alpha-L-fucosidase